MLDKETNPGLSNPNRGSEASNFFGQVWTTTQAEAIPTLQPGIVWSFHPTRDIIPVLDTCGNSSTAWPSPFDHYTETKVLGMGNHGKQYFSTSCTFWPLHFHESIAQFRI